MQTESYHYHLTNPDNDRLLLHCHQRRIQTKCGWMDTLNFVIVEESSRVCSNTTILLTLVMAMSNDVHGSQVG